MNLARDDLTKVAIVADNDDACSFLQRLLQRCREFRCVACYANAEEAILEVPRTSPRAVLMECQLPGMSGIDCARLLKGLLPGLGVVLLSRIADLETISAARKAGADYYLTIPFTIRQCLTAVRFTVGQSGSGTGDSRASDPPLAGCEREARRLTKRENEVIRGFEKGMLYKEVADELGISRSTVHFHQHAIFQKLQVSNRTEAINRWREVYES